MTETEVSDYDASAHAAPSARVPRVVTVRVSTLIVLLLASLVASAVIFIANYDPLVQGSMSGVDPHAVDQRIETLGEPDTVMFLDHEQGESFYAMFTVRNDGRLPISIERLGNRQQRGVFYAVDALVHPGEESTGAVALPTDQWSGFSSFRLGPSAERRVAIEYRFGHCAMGSGEVTSIDSVPVRFSIFGIGRNTEFQLPYALALRSPSGGGCP